MTSADDIVIRDWKPSDAAALATNLNHPEVVRYLGETIPFPYTIRHARVFIGMTNCCENKLAKAIVVNDEVVGSISLTPKDDIFRLDAELGFFLGKNHWGKGIMHRAIQKMTRFAFENFDLVRIHCQVIEENLQSIKVLQKAGFKQEGILRNAAFKDGQLMNTCLMSILRAELFPLRSDS
ncbi:MAG: GNAT family protein [Bacteroidales bacterium]